MKKILGFISIVVIFPLLSGAQNDNQLNRKIEIGFAIDPSLGGSGIIIKTKKKVVNRRHFEGYAGFAGQFHRNKETKFSRSVSGGTTDLGVYLVSDWLVYPFSSKHVFMGTEIFAGVTSLHTNGVLRLPDHSVTERYSHQYSYFNYGAALSLGYDFGRISTNVFINASLKGLLDKGRFRPMDTDSKGFTGLSIGVKF